MKTGKKAIWIAWEHQLRNRSMAAMLGVELRVISRDGGRVMRYLRCGAATTLIMIKERPDIVFAPNPSIVLNYLLLALRPVCRFKFVTDAHYGGVIAYNGSSIFQRALDLCNRSADLAIVTNSAHAEHVKAIGGNVVVCEDPLPDLRRHESGVSAVEKAIFFICSFDVDEPYLAAFDAAAELAREGFRFFVSGNFKKAGIDPADHPNVIFLGFVPETEFYAHLFASEVVLDLTENENCLVCGAYEAMAAEKPLVTSGTTCLREYFHRGTVFSEHDSPGIAEAIRVAYRDRERLSGEAREWKVLTLKAEKVRQARLFSILGMN